MTNDQAAITNEQTGGREPLGIKSLVIDWSLRLGHWSLILLIVGCSETKPTTQPSDIRSRQEAALKDPFGYSVDIDKQSNVSGGGIMELDKEGLKRDTEHVLNP